MSKRFAVVVLAVLLAIVLLALLLRACDSKPEPVGVVVTTTSSTVAPTTTTIPEAPSPTKDPTKHQLPDPGPEPTRLAHTP